MVIQRGSGLRALLSPSIGETSHVQGCCCKHRHVVSPSLQRFVSTARQTSANAVAKARRPGGSPCQRLALLIAPAPGWQQRAASSVGHQQSSLQSTSSVDDAYLQAIEEKAARKAQWQRKSSSSSFVDSLTLEVTAGSGGDGCVAFSREKYVVYGPPAGGGGGRGGDVYIRAVSHLRSLARVPNRAEGGPGGHGKGDWIAGGKGKDMTLSVPVGTIVTVEQVEDDPLEPKDQHRVLWAEYEQSLIARYERRFRRNFRSRRPRLQRAVAQANEKEDDGGDTSDSSFQFEQRSTDLDGHEEPRDHGTAGVTAQGALHRAQGGAPETEEPSERLFHLEAQSADPTSQVPEEEEEVTNGRLVKQEDAEQSPCDEVDLRVEDYSLSEMDSIEPSLPDPAPTAPQDSTLLSPREVESAREEEEEELASIAAEERLRRDAMWRHYPGSSAGQGSPTTAHDVIEDSESDVATQKRHFKAAEERLAMAILKRRLMEEQEAALPSRRSPDPILPLASSNGDEEIGSASRSSITYDLDEPTSVDSPGLLVARGGSGGYGNPFFLSTGAITRSPKFATRGSPGQRVRLSLELKCPADVGLVGYPNAGKSTLLKALTSAGRAGDANAKVGGYEFTTLSPNVGVLRLASDGSLLGTGTGVIQESETLPHLTSGRVLKERLQPRLEASKTRTNARQMLREEVARLTIADLPGLISGASENKGLGHLFLRHAERCRALIYVVDVSEKCPAPWEQVAALQHELEAYSPGLSSRCALVVANKCDALGPKTEVDNAQNETASDASVEKASEHSSPRSSGAAARSKLSELHRRVCELHGGRALPVMPISAKHRLGVEILAKEVSEVVRRIESTET